MGETLTYEASDKHAKLIMPKLNLIFSPSENCYTFSLFHIIKWQLSLFPVAQAKLLELSLNVPSVPISLSYSTSNSSSNTVSSTLKIYPESDHFYHLHCSHLGLKRCYLLAELSVTWTSPSVSYCYDDIAKQSLSYLPPFTCKETKPGLQIQVSWVPFLHSHTSVPHSQHSLMAEALLEAMGSVRLADFPHVSLSGLLPWDRTLFEEYWWFMSQKKEAILCR